MWRPNGSASVAGSCEPGGEEAPLEALGDLLAIELAADEDEAVDPLLVFAPGAARPSLEVPMHALQQEPVVVALEVEDALHPEHLVAELADHRTEPDAELQAVEHAGPLDADGVDVL